MVALSISLYASNPNLDTTGFLPFLIQHARALKHAPAIRSFCSENMVASVTSNTVVGGTGTAHD